MGLDISAYGQLVFVKMVADADPADDENLLCFSGDPSFPNHHHPLNVSYTNERAAYRCDGDQMGFRAGSYSGYNLWRSQLAEMALGVPDRVVWDNPEEYQDRPFYHLINFSDCEGTIGSTLAKKLAADFRDHQALADAHEDERFRAKYILWRQAFELAADDGAVVFG